MRMNPSIESEVDRYLSALDGNAPGVFDRIYLIGSAAWGDFRPGRSDIGFVGVAAAVLGAAEHEALRRTHGALTAEGPSSLDGIYVTPNDLVDGPIRRPTGPHVRSGLYFAEGDHKRRPADWQMLRTSARLIHGPDCESLEIWKCVAALDRDALNAAEEILRDLRGLPPGGPVPTDAGNLSSFVLGVARLHYTLLTGQVTSKCKAGLYGLVTLPDWKAVLDEAIDARRLECAAIEVFPHLRDGLLPFVEAVVTDMRALAADIGAA